MKITEYINQAEKTLFSFEILPPLKGQSLNNLLEGISPLMEFKPPFVDVTYHREEFIYKKHPNGLLEKVSTKKRPGVDVFISNRKARMRTQLLTLALLWSGV